MLDVLVCVGIDERETAEGYVAEADSRALQVAKVTNNVEGTRSVEFNMYLDMEGDSSREDDRGSTTQTENGVTVSTRWLAVLEFLLSHLFWGFIILLQ